MIGIQTFGTEDCCLHNPDGREDQLCDAAAYGLMDKFGPHSVGSDCNRAEPFMLRPADELMDAELKAKLADGEMVGVPTGFTLAEWEQMDPSAQEQARAAERMRIDGHLRRAGFAVIDYSA